MISPPPSRSVAERRHVDPPSRARGGSERPRRAPWRQRLVEAERGLALGFRGDSTFFVHFFGMSVIVATGFVLSLELWQWTVIVLALTLVLSAELFHRVLGAIWQSIEHHLDEPARHAHRIGTAAVCVAISGALLAIALVFGQRLTTMFAG